MTKVIQVCVIFNYFWGYVRGGVMLGVPPPPSQTLKNRNIFAKCSLVSSAGEMERDNHSDSHLNVSIF